MTRQEWLLLALVSAEHGMTPVQVQKTMFLLRMEAPTRLQDDFYNFEPYDYGPFTSDIYTDLEVLSGDGLVTIDRFSAAPRRIYSATPAGAQRSLALRQRLDSDMAAYMDRLVAWVKSKSFTGLLNAIYAKYPEYRENSVFVG